MNTSAVTAAQPMIRPEVPAQQRVFAPWPQFGPEETQIVTEVLQSGQVNYWTGPHGRAFEEEFAWACGTNHGVALVNGTVALELALRSLGIRAGDEVIVTPRSFFASASAIVMQGAKPVFADVDPDSQNISARTIAPVITQRTKAILAVHLAGMPCEMNEILDLAGAHGLYVIEDCAQAHGAHYRGRPVGSMGHAGAFSFCQDKILSTGGEGGMLVTSDESTWRRAWSFKDHGKSHEKSHAKKEHSGFRWVHTGFGTNWRMTEMQAAIGRSQLRKLPSWHEQRKRNASVLSAGFEGIAGLRVPEIGAHLDPGWYKYYTFVRPQALKSDWSRDRIMEAVVSAGVPCFTGSCPEIYREDAFRQSGLPASFQLPVAHSLGQTSLMFLVHPTLGEQEMRDTIDTVASVMAQATR